MGRVTYGRSRAVQESVARLSSALQENLSALPIVRSYAMEEHEVHSDTSLHKKPRDIDSDPLSAAGLLGESFT